MGLDGQCGIFDELIILCVQYMYQRGTITECQLGCTLYGTAYWYYVECALVRVHLYRALRTFVRSRLRLTCAEGSWQFYSCRGDPDVAVEGARRGSRIWLVSGR